MKEKSSRITRFINKETVLYTIVGVGTSIFNIALFQILLLLKLDYKIANFISLVAVKLAAYICNKNLVFQSKCENWIELAKEFGRFVIFRGATMVLDYVGLIAMVDYMKLDKFVSKCFVTVVVIGINYFTGKKQVFKNKVGKGK